MTMKDRREERTTPVATEVPAPPKPRPARFFRAVVATALAAMAPAAGCYDSTTGDDVAGDADARDSADASDGADHLDAVVPYGVPDFVEATDDVSGTLYGIPDYGAPAYGVP